MIPPPPRASPLLHGHAAQAEALAHAVRAGRLAHGWLFCGPPGVGKATLAYRFARWLLASGPPWPPGAAPLWLDPADTVFRRVAGGAHADLLALEPESEAGRRRIIRVEEVRAARQFLALTAAEGGWRVVVVDGAEAMEAASANTLLKTLEEPPPRTVIILISSAPGRLLPTIRSRCRRMEFFPLPDAALDVALAGWLPDLPAAERAALVGLAEGSPGRALELAQGQGVALARLAAETLAALPDARGAHALADRIAGRDAADAFPAFFALLLRQLRAALRDAARGHPAPGWLAARPLHEWAEAASEVARQAETAERLSLDRRQAVLVAMETLRGG